MPEEIIPPEKYKKVAEERWQDNKTCPYCGAGEITVEPIIQQKMYDMKELPEGTFTKEAIEPPVPVRLMITLRCSECNKTERIDPIASMF